MTAVRVGQRAPYHAGEREKGERALPRPLNRACGYPPRVAERVTDRRYRTKRWQRARLRVLNRDAWICRVVQGCPEPATVADHIIPAHDGMPDALFFGPGNLRAACRNHNLARGLTEHLQPSGDVVTKDYSG